MLRVAPASRALREAFPAVVEPVAVVLTHLRGVTGLLLGLSLLYWLTDRRATALVVAYAVAGYAVVLGLEWLFALPRPPEAVWTIETSGYGFPSGHATGAAVVWGIALEFDRVDSLTRAAPLAGLAGLVALSRVVLGVHLLGDILAGLALGTALVVALHHGADGNPPLAFGAAGILGLAALSTTWGDGAAVPEVLGIVGACVGGAVTTWNMGAIPRFGSRARAVALVVAGLAFLVAVQAVEGALTGVFAVVDDAVLVAGVVRMPQVVDRIWAVGDERRAGASA